MITVKRVDVRYATALLQIAKEQGVENIVYNDMLELRALIIYNSDFKNFLNSPVIKTSQKAKILQTLFNDHLNKLTLEFLLLILKKVRIGNILNIATAYVRMYRDEFNFKTVTAYTEKDLLDEQKQELLDALNKQFPDKTVELRYRIHPEIIGGLFLRYDDYLYDGTVATQLKDLRQKFKFNLYESQL